MSMRDGQQKEIVCDGLKFDGKTVVVPSYWLNTINDIVNEIDQYKLKKKWKRGDFEDFEIFKNFLSRSVSAYENASQEGN